LRNDTVAFGIGYVVGLLALLLWPDRKGADQDVVVLVGLTIATSVGVVLWLASGSRPTFDLLAFVTQTGPPRKPVPRRSWIPRFLGHVAAISLVTWLRWIGAPDWGLAGYVLWMPLLYGGFALSDLIGAKAAEPRRVQ
jgi:hypothetical protein